MNITISLLLLAIAVWGNSWFWASFVSWLYALPWRDHVLDRFRHIGDAGMIVVPCLLVYQLFFRELAPAEPVLMSQAGWVGHTDKLDWALIPWSFSLLGLVLFGYTQSQRWSHQLRCNCHKTDSQVFDVAKELGHQPAGRGCYSGLLSVPGNQAFTYEFNTKQLELARLPPAFHQLRILHLTDLHFTGALNLEYYQHLLDRVQKSTPDLIVFTGDLLDDPQLIDWIPQTLGQLSAPLGCYFILGNHDWLQDAGQIRSLLKEQGWRNCQGELHSLQREGQRLWLGGDERPWMGEAADFSPAAEHDFRLLLSHTPDNFPWAREQKIDLMLSGHNHGGQIQFPVIGPVLSPSRYGVQFASGEFYLAPTTLHVSRGIAGRHPLRIRCRPEVTLLELLCPASKQS